MTCSWNCALLPQQVPGDAACLDAFSAAAAGEPPRSISGGEVPPETDCPLARALVSARDHKRGWAFYDRMMKIDLPDTPAGVREEARVAGVPAPVLNRGCADPAVLHDLHCNLREARDQQLEGLPALYFNGRRYTAERSAEMLELTARHLENAGPRP